jgi:hypothetical protein
MAPLLRTALLLLIAVLLPLRGAVAVSMACAGGATAMAVVALDEHAAHADHSAHHGTHHGEPRSAAHASADKCNLCAASGAATPLPITLPALGVPAAFRVLRYPRLTVLVTAFVADGPERPPRRA